MRYLLMAMLFLFTAASAQPTRYTVLAPNGNVHSPRISLRDSMTADVFYIRRDENGEQYVDHAVTSVTGHNLIAGPEILLHTAGWTPQIGDVIARADTGWAAVLYESSPYVNMRSTNVTRLYKGRDAFEDSVQLDAGESSSSPVFSCGGEHYNMHMRIREAATNGWLVSWIRAGCRSSGQFSEPWNRHLEVYVPSDLQADSVIESCPDAFLFGPTGGFSLWYYPDSVATLSVLPGSSPVCCYHTLNHPAQRGSNLVCPTPVWDFRRTYNERILILAGADPKQLLEVHRDGTVTVDRDLDIPSFDAIAFQQYLGYAVLSIVDHTMLILNRVDITGLDVQPRGVFYQCPSGSVIAEASLAVCVEGRMSVLWTEHPEGATDTTELWAASIDWLDYLGVNDPHFVPRPSSITLSAYPNPFNSTLRVEYSLPSAARGELAMYNLLGQKVAVLKDGMLETGHAIVNWTPEGAAGIYFAVLKTATQSRTAKVVYLK